MLSCLIAMSEYMLRNRFSLESRRDSLPRDGKRDLKAERTKAVTVPTETATGRWLEINLL